jgi:hypothetical protein
MSDIPEDLRERLDIAELVSRIERQQEETRKFTAEQHKLQAEGNRYNRDKWILPLTALLSAIGITLAAVIARLPEILHAFGVG